ncbi:transglycosylase SLT domain-containing protein [Nocardia transvalensis]|uniref:transglycosylase SLT domain-containing protein n=1 Tax=Nocardia transvalensis TaxID=37333 RepID=UPI0018961C1D|nr:transglycosylase SLT domain-containing protein [Nocardia transvalensis]MBF6333319.1 transglycosylase SLT domain-containing protein [Nocardia transvalensis]
MSGVAQAYSAGSSRLTVYPELARDFVTRLRTQLDRVRVTLPVRVLPNLDGFAAELRARLAALRDVGIGVRITPDLTGFAARLDAELARFRGHRIGVRIDTDHSQLQQLSQLFGQLGGRASPAGASISGLGSTMTFASVAASALKAAILGLVVGALFPLMAVAAQAAGTVALLPAAATAAAAGFAAVAVGVTGVKDAFIAAAQASESASQDAEARARSIAAAQRGEQQATRGVEQARKDLNRAYADASKRLRDLELQARGAALSEGDALLSIAEARRDRAQLQSTDPLDYARANQRVADAEQRLLEVRARRADIDEQVAKARTGVEGDDQVVAARERLADSERQLADARTALTDATTQVAPAQQAFERAMAKLSPAAADFVTKIRGLSAAWTSFRMAVQEPLFDGLGDSVVRLADSQLGRVQDGLAAIAATINAGIRRVLDDLATPETGDKLDKIFRNAEVAIGPLIDGVRDLAQGLLSLAGVGSEFLPGLSKSFADTMASFRAWAESPEGQQRFRDFLQRSLDALAKMWELAKSVGQALAVLVTSARPSGESMLDSLVRNLDRFSAWLASPEGRQAMASFWDDVRTTVTNLASLAVFLGRAAEKLYEFLDLVRDVTGINIMQGALFTLLEQLRKVPDALSTIRDWLAEHLPGALSSSVLDFAGFGDALDALRRRVTEIVAAIGAVWDGLRETMAAPINWVIEHVVNGGFKSAWNAIRTVVPLLPEWTADVPLIPVARRASGGPAEGRVSGPGSRTSDSIPALLSRDEHVWTAAEVDAVGGHAQMYRMRRAALAGQLPGFRDGGGVLGSIGDWVGDKLASVTARVREKVAELFVRPLREIASAIPDFGGGIGAVPRAVVDQVAESAIGVIGGRAATQPVDHPRSGPVLAAGEGVQRWREVALEALRRTNTSESYVDLLLYQMQTESGGDQYAINLWDSNAQRGTPSKGLMQVIDPTFHRYRDPTLSDDIYDPLANIVAAINYSKAAYPSLEAAWRGVGYDTGGIWPSGTLGWNASGKPEAVLTNEQWRWFREFIDSLAQPVPGQQKPGLDDPVRTGLDLGTWDTLGRKATDAFQSAGEAAWSGQLDDALAVIGAPNLLTGERARALDDYARAYQMFEATKAARAAGATDFQQLMDQVAPAPAPTDIPSPSAGPVSNVDNSVHITVQTRDVDEGFRRAQQIADLRSLQHIARR